MSSWIIQSDSNPCTWHLILTSLAPSIAGNTMVTLTGASHCHIVWNSNNSVIATTRAVHYCPGTFFNQFNFKTTLEPLLSFFNGIFVPKGSLLTWHYCFVSLSATGTGHGDYKAVYFPGSVDVLLVIMKHSSSNSWGKSPKIQTALHSVRFYIYHNGCKIILNILCCLVFSNVALLTPLLLLWVPWCQILFLIALNKILQTMSQWLTVSSVMIMNMNSFILSDQYKGQVIPSCNMCPYITVTHVIY